MTRLTRVSLSTAMVLGAATVMAGTVHAQQFGPPQQSLYAHNPGSAPTYVTSKQYVPSVYAPAQTGTQAVKPASAPAHRAPASRTTATAHPVTLRKKTTTPSAH